MKGNDSNPHNDSISCMPQSFTTANRQITAHRGMNKIPPTLIKIPEDVPIGQAMGISGHYMAPDEPNVVSSRELTEILAFWLNYCIAFAKIFSFLSDHLRYLTGVPDMG